MYKTDMDNNKCVFSFCCSRVCHVTILQTTSINTTISHRPGNTHAGIVLVLIFFEGNLRVLMNFNTSHTSHVNIVINNLLYSPFRT